MLIALAIFGVLSLLTLVFCVCLGITAAKADRAADASLRAAGVSFPTQAQTLASKLERPGATAISRPTRGTSPRPAIN